MKRMKGRPLAGTVLAAAFVLLAFATANAAPTDGWSQGRLAHGVPLPQSEAVAPPIAATGWTYPFGW